MGLFDQEGIEIPKVVRYLIDHRQYVSTDDLQAIRQAFQIEKEGAGPAIMGVSGTQLDLLQEVEEQLALARKLRTAANNATNTLESAREIKDSMTAGTSLLQLVNKLYNDIYNMNRLRLIEDAVVKAMAEMPDEYRNRFMHILKERLESVQ